MHLSLDADEEVEPALAQGNPETRWLAIRGPRVSGVPRKELLPRVRWVRHGGFYPDPKLRLFRRGAGMF